MCCCHGQLSPFPGATCQPLGSLAVKCRKLQAMTLLPLEIRNAAYGNKSKTLSPNSVKPYSTVLIIIVSMKFNETDNDNYS